MDIEERMQNLMKKPRPCSRFLDILRRRELDGRSSGVFSMPTIIGAEFVKSVNVRGHNDRLCSIAGIVVLHNNKLVVIDEENASIKVIDADTDIITAERTLSSPPYDITMVALNEVAISLSRENEILFVRIDNGIEIVRTFEVASMDSFENSISYCRGKLFVASHVKGKVRVLDMEGKFERYIGRSQNSGPKHITSSADNSQLCIAHGKDIFVVVKFDGTIVAQYKQVKFIPRTTTIDGNGNVHFFNRKCQTMYQASTYSKTGKMLLWIEGEENDIFWANCTTYSDAENKFYIGEKYCSEVCIYRAEFGIKR